MSERERTIIRVAGLAVHALGFVVLVLGILAGSSPVMIVGVLAFAVGGAWGWGLVRAAANEAERERQNERARVAAAERRGLNTFTASFDDEPERPPGVTARLTPPPPLTD